jgi:hypothetical protein
VASTLGLRLRSLPARWYLLWAVVLVVVAAVPAAVNAARPSEHTASVEAFLTGPSAARSPAGRTAYLRALLADPRLAQDAKTISGQDVDPASLRDRIDFKPTSRSVVITVRADTPQHARDLANALAYAFANASGRRLSARAQAQLVRVRAGLQSRPLKRRRRIALRAAERKLESAAANPGASVVFGPRPSTAKPDQRLDRWLDDLPGPYPPRRDPLWAALAGLLVGCAFCLASLLLWARGQPRPAPADGARVGLQLPPSRTAAHVQGELPLGWILALPPPRPTLVYTPTSPARPARSEPTLESPSNGHPDPGPQNRDSVLAGLVGGLVGGFLVAASRRRRPRRSARR